MYVKLSTYSAYCLLCENHLIPAFWEVYDITEKLVQQYILNEFNNGLNKKTIKDILIVSDCWQNGILESKFLKYHFLLM